LAIFANQTVTISSQQLALACGSVTWLSSASPSRRSSVRASPRQARSHSTTMATPPWRSRARTAPPAPTRSRST
jgi:hypothetical protein